MELKDYSTEELKAELKILIMLYIHLMICTKNMNFLMVHHLA